MRKVSKIILLALFVLLIPLMFLFFSFYIGLLSSITFNKLAERKEQWLILQEVQGKYSKVGLAISNVKNYLEQQNINCIPVAAYYDNPKKIITKNMRGAGGCSLSHSLENIPKDFKIIYLPQTSVIMASIKAYPEIAVKKVLPAIDKYTEENNIDFNYPIFAFFNDSQVNFTFIWDKIE